MENFDPTNVTPLKNIDDREEARRLLHGAEKQIAQARHDGVSAAPYEKQAHELRNTWKFF